MRERQKRIVRLLALQDRRLLVESAACANINRQIDELNEQIRALCDMLDRDDPVAFEVTKLIMERLMTIFANRRVAEAELEKRLAETRALKLQIKRIDKVSDQLSARMREDRSAREKAGILERYSRVPDVSAE
jgi:ferritin-like metal-binding protein YciE